MLMNLPTEILYYLFQFIVNKQDWINIKLSCKLFNELTYNLFDPSIDYNSALFYSIHRNLIISIKWLIIHPKVDPTTYDNLPIGWASAKGYVEIVKLLLQ